MMEIKIKIPTLFTKYRVVKKGGKYYAQKKERYGWTWMGEDGYGWLENAQSWAASFSTVEEAIELIDSQRVKVVWGGR